MKQIIPLLADLFYWIGERFYRLGDWIAPPLHNLTEETKQEFKDILK